MEIGKRMKTSWGLEFIAITPEEWKKVIPCSNAAPHILLLRLFEPCDARVWDAVRGMTPFHKLSYKFDDEKARIPGTYYRKLMDGQE